MHRVISFVKHSVSGSWELSALYNYLKNKKQAKTANWKKMGEKSVEAIKKRTNH